MFAHPIVKCSKPLAANASAAPLDVVKMKSALGALGHYEAPDWGVSQFPDAALFDAIKAFQKSQGLKVDGAIKPDGETEAALSQAMTPRRAQTALQATAQALQSLGRGGDELLAHITPEEAALLHNVTDGASVHPDTGLLEFGWFGFGGDDDTSSYESSVSTAADDSNLSDKDFWSGYEAATTAYDAANSDGRNGFGGSDDDSGTSGNGAQEDQSTSGNPSSGLTSTKQAEDKTKTDADRRSRGLGQTVNVGGLLNPKEKDEDGEDAAFDPDAPKDDKPSPGPKADEGGEKKDNPSFIDNFFEDLGDIFSGNINSPHSAHDVRTAEAMANKYGFTGEDRKTPFLRGGEFGPGRGKYSPTGNYDAYLGNRVDGSRLTTGKSAKNFPGLLAPGHPDYIAPNALDDLVAAFEADAQKAKKENRQRMAEIDKARQRTARAAARQQELAQVRSAPQVDYFSKNGVTFTDNLASNLIGGRASATATPKDGLLERTQDQKAADVGEQPTGKKTSLLADYGAPVGAESFREWLNDLNASQPGFMGPKSPAVPETTVNAPSDLEVVRSGDVQGGIAVGRKLDQLARTNPEALKSLHRELQSYQKGYSAKLHSNYMEKKAPKPSSPNYASEKRKYDKWVERREQEAQLEGLKKAGSHWNNKAFVRAPTETTVNLASGVRSLGGNPLHNNTQIGINNRLKALDIPKGYRNLPGIQVSQGLGEGLAFAGGLPAAPFEAAGRISRTLSLEGASKKTQMAYAYGHAGLNLAPGLATKVNAAAVRAYMKVKKSNLLDPVYDNAIMLGETVGDALSGFGMDWALEKRSKDTKK